MAPDESADGNGGTEAAAGTAADTAPVGDGTTAPAGDETADAADATAPAGDATAPAGDATADAADATAPAGDATAPAGDATADAADATAPAGDATAGTAVKNANGTTPAGFDGGAAVAPEKPPSEAEELRGAGWVLLPIGGARIERLEAGATASQKIEVETTAPPGWELRLAAKAVEDDVAAEFEVLGRPGAAADAGATAEKRVVTLEPGLDSRTVMVLLHGSDGAFQQLEIPEPEPKEAPAPNAGDEKE